MTAIRLLRAADRAAYRSLMLHAYQHAADAFTSTADERAAEPDAWWLQRLGDSQAAALAFGAFDGDAAGAALLGSVALEFATKPKTRHKALLIGMYVLPPARGSGVGRALVQAALAHCVQRGTVRCVQLEATEGNAPALALYQSLGFRPFGVEPMGLLTPDGFKAKVHLWLPLGDGVAGVAAGVAADAATDVAGDAAGDGATDGATDTATDAAANRAARAQPA